MKHLFLTNEILTYMVYYAPKKKAQMYELIFKREQEYNRNPKGEVWGLLQAIVITLQNNGFKCVEITTEIKDTLNVLDDLAHDCFKYRGITINESMYSGYHFFIGNTLNSCLTIEQAIKEIDNVL